MTNIILPCNIISCYSFKQRVRIRLGRFNIDVLCYNEIRVEMTRNDLKKDLVGKKNFVRVNNKKIKIKGKLKIYCYYNTQ